MPKEIISLPSNLGEDANQKPLVAQVTWGIDTEVQLATINVNEEMYSEKSGWWVTLDRSMINRLIKTLRKARDQAYGVDE